jgi:glycine/D-amino acid oxidase-like deaminating enzyme
VYTPLSSKSATQTPHKTDVLVVGGGLAGCATAYYLAKAGIEVLVIERDELNLAASGANAGSFHAQIPHLTFCEQGDAWGANFAPVVEMLVAGIELWRGLEAELDTDLETRIGGGVLIADRPEQMRDIERRMALERAHGLQIHALTREELRAMAPYAAPEAVGGCFCPIEGKANPLKTGAAFARRAEERGAQFRRRTELLALEEASMGFRATTSSGVIEAKRVVNCAGALAGQVAAMLGIDVAIQGFPIQVNVTAAVAPTVPHLVYAAGHRLTLKQTANGTFLIGGGWPARLDPKTGRAVVDFNSMMRNLAIAKLVVPIVAQADLVRSWAAVVDGTEDWKPVIGEAPGHPGFFFNFFPWTGFTAGPISALVTSELVTGRRPSIDIARYSSLVA